MNPRHRHTFIVKLWGEERARKELPMEWRIRVEHVQTARRSHFRNLLASLQFIQQTCQECSGSAPELTPESPAPRANGAEE